MEAVVGPVFCGISGDKMKFSLCVDCASKDLNIKVFLGGGKLPSNIIMCPGCGTSPAKIRKLRRFGCARCYDLFGDYILGKQDFAAPLINEPNDEYEELKKKLFLAVKKEDYEEAARLRDELAKLKK